MPRRIAIKYCRHCGYIIPLDSTDCPYCGHVTIRRHEQKECPFCGEPIKADARKCKHCGEFVDGRPPAQPPDMQQVLHIEKAIIAVDKPEGQAELFRPDGTVLRHREKPERAKPRLPEGKTPRALHAQAPAEPPPEHEQDIVALPTPPEQITSAPPALPEPVTKLPPALYEPVTKRPRTLLRSVTSAALTLARRAISRTRPGRPSATDESADQLPAAPPVSAPPVELECPSCRRTVFEGDHYCENCGRDLTLPRDVPGLRPIARLYGPAEIALILGAAAPLGLFLPMPLSLVLPVGCIALAGWCGYHILGSKGRLTGIKPTAGALALGILWLVVIPAAQAV